VVLPDPAIRSARADDRCRSRLLPRVTAAWNALEPQWQDIALTQSDGGETGRRLLDLGDERFAAMEDTGFDVQVLSLTAPGVQSLEPDQAIALQTASTILLLRRCGRTRVDDRRVLSGIIFVNRNGSRWCDAPKDYGPHKTLYNRWKRLGGMGVFLRMMEGLAAEGAEPKTVMIDATYLKAHRTRIEPAG
jgi:transposase